MRNLLIGIDSGTQSTKALVVDSRDGKVLASATQAYDLIPEPASGRKRAASRTRGAMPPPAPFATPCARPKPSPAEVKAIGVSGQQHGFVPLDGKGEVIRPAKLWCDTSTAAECDEITEKLGGLKKTIKRIGQRRPARLYRFQNSLAEEA